MSCEDVLRNLPDVPALFSFWFLFVVGRVDMVRTPCTLAVLLTPVLSTAAERVH